MSKRLKNELTQLFQMVCNGLNIVKEPIQQEDRVAYLTSMQEAVICIGTKVEKVVPECEAFVGQLSSLAEYFYQLSLGECSGVGCGTGIVRRYYRRVETCLA